MEYIFCKYAIAETMKKHFNETLYGDEIRTRMLSKILSVQSIEFTALVSREAFQKENLEKKKK